MKYFIVSKILTTMGEVMEVPFVTDTLTGDYKFPMGKITSRSASEPMGSLVT
jgi:hypothetical protein